MKFVQVTIDRPIGYVDSYGNCYPLNYGFVPGVMGGDGEEQDVYVLSHSQTPLETFEGKVIAIIHRQDDVEEKWVACHPDEYYSKEEIQAHTHFIEQYFCSSIKML